MRTDERSATRTLVRWNDDLDKSILLFITFACAEAGIKIPFGRVAELMGPRFSEGAIVQHIAKVRNKMQDEKEKTNPELLVPPPNKRGSVTKSASAMCYTNSRQRKTSDFSDLIYESNIKSKRGKVKRELEEDDDDRHPDYEWGSRETSSFKKSKKIPGKRKQDILTLRYSGVKPVADDDSEDAHSPTSIPARPRRGLKVNYASMVDGVSDNEESGAEDGIHGEASKPGRNIQFSSRKTSSSSGEFSPNVCTVQRNPSFPAIVSMDSTTPDTPDTGLMPPLENGIGGGVRELPLLPHQHWHNPFMGFNFNACTFSTSPGIALSMPTGVPVSRYANMSHGSVGQRASLLPLTPIPQTTKSNDSITTLAPDTIPMLNPTSACNSISTYDDLPMLESTNWDRVNQFEDEKLPSPKYFDFLNFDHNSAA